METVLNILYNSEARDAATATVRVCPMAVLTVVTLPLPSQLTHSLLLYYSRMPEVTLYCSLSSLLPPDNPVSVWMMISSTSSNATRKVVTAVSELKEKLKSGFL